VLRAVAIDRAVSAYVLAAVVALVLAGTAQAETRRGLTVAPEHRYSSYDRNRDYRYPQSIEREIVRRLDAVCGPDIWQLLFEHVRDGHLTHGGDERGPRQLPLRCRQGNT